MCDNALTWQYLRGRDKADLPEEADKERVDIYGQPDNELAQPRHIRSGRAYCITSSVLPKSILQKPKQAQNLQLDTPGPDCAQIRASTRAHLNAKQRGLDPPGHPGHLGTVCAEVTREQDTVPVIKKVNWDENCTIAYYKQDFLSLIGSPFLGIETFLGIEIFFFQAFL